MEVSYTIYFYSRVLTEGRIRELKIEMNIWEDKNKSSHPEGTDVNKLYLEVNIVGYLGG